MLKKTFFIGVLISLTTACASLPSGKSAKQLYLEATTQHMFTKSYNFKQTVNGSDLSSIFNASFEEYLKESIEENLKESIEENTKNETGKSGSKLKDPNDKQKSEKFNKVLQGILKGFKTETYGAYDPQRGMMEFVSGIEYSQNNVNASLYIPMLINWKDPSLTLGPSLLNYFLLPDSHNDNKQGLIFKLSDAPAGISENIMRYVKNILPAVIKNSHDGFSAIDDKNFNFKSLESSDDIYDAHYKIDYAYSLKDILTALEKTLKLSVEQLENDFVTTKNLEQRKHMLNPQELKMMTSMIGVFKPMLEKSLGKNSEFSILEDGLTFSGDMYLDSWGRPKYILSKFNLNIAGETMSYTTHTEISNYGAATFTFDSNNVKYFNGADIIKEKMPEFKKLMKK